MIVRKLLTTTAVTMLLATGAFAQEATTNTTAPASGTATQAVVSGESLASNLMGQDVYNGAGQDASKIGDVNDLVVGSDGMIKSVIIGVGGFLGIGEKDVAINYSDIKWTAAQGANGATSGNRWLVANATKESLQALPAFNRSAFENRTAGNGTAANNNMAATDNNTNSMANGNTADSSMAAAPDTSTTTAAVDRSKMTAMTPDKMTADNLIGTNVYGANDAKVGEIADIVLDKSQKVDAVLIDVGGFLGIGSKRVAVGMDNLQFMQAPNDGGRYLYTKMTKEQLEAQPAYNADTYAQQRDQQRMTVQ